MLFKRVINQRQFFIVQPLREMAHSGKKQSAALLVRGYMGTFPKGFRHPEEILCRIEIGKEKTIAIELVAENQAQVTYFFHGADCFLFLRAAVLQAMEQNLTSSQTFSHFFRHV